MKNLIILFLSLFLTLWQANAQRMDFNIDHQKLGMAFYAISNMYVDPTDNSKLVENAITGMLEKLDPHSEYSDPEETKSMNEPLQGNFDGVGIQFNMLTDTVYIVQVISGGPSEKVGIAAGDRIIMIDDTLVAGVKMKNTDIQKRLRGKRGTTVRVKVQRRSAPDLIEYIITRGAIPIYSLDASYMVDKQTGYIRLNRFARKSAEEVQEAIVKLRKEGMKNLIFDLQDNGGGYMDIAEFIANEFLAKGKLIVYTEGNSQPRDVATSSSTGNFETGRLVVMVNESSASASEILAGAVQDWDRAVIVGRRTFGKGLVQKAIPLPDGSMIRLTVARYYTPSGRSIQKPYEKGNTLDYNRDLISRYNRGELMSADSIHFPDSMKYTTLVSKRVVYGGGGIMPDLFIPIDTTVYTDYHRRIVASGILNRITMNYVDDNRKELKANYGKIETFKKSFSVSEKILDGLKAMAEAEKITYSEEEYSRSKSLIALQIKALIARDLFDTSEYFQIINDVNDSYQAALRIINDAEGYNKILGYGR